jgi:acetylornithine/N-succinyldiaminopimelate aminotransferase
MMKYLWNVHERDDVTFSKGKGVYLFSRTFLKNKKYLDFNAGGGVNSLGYGNKKVIRAISKQVKKIWHLSNYYQNKLAEKLASELCKTVNSEKGFNKVFFTNSGTEGVEFAIKTARKFFRSQDVNKFEIISLENGFHGRTYGSLSASANSKYKEGFGPFLEGFINVKAEISEIEKKISEKTAAILVEPIQGADGINFLGWEFLTNLKTLCEKYNILLIFDEVQTGMGRTGKLFAFQHTEIIPDIMILSKGIAAGFPFGAVLTREEIANSIGLSSHGGTFNANLLGIVAARSTLSQINKAAFLENVVNSSAILELELQSLKKDFPNFIISVKGFGLMRGLELSSSLNAKELVKQFSKKERLLLGTAAHNVLRITPPLIITPDEIKLGISKIQNFLSNLYKAKKRGNS